MFQPLFVAASGLETFEHEISDITNNLSNARTIGFKKGRLERESLFYTEKSFSQHLTQAMDRSGGGAGLAGTHLGGGVRVTGSVSDFSQGSVEVTNNVFDMAIQGEGFFQLRLPDGTLAYTRAGNFHIDNDGNLVNPNGNFLDPSITFPSGTTSFQVRPDGVVFATIDGQATPQEAGQVTLARFPNSAGLVPIGKNLYQTTPASGEAIIGVASADGYGSISQFALEQSNVDVIQELMRMTLAQRLFEVVSRAVQAYDGMLQSLNQIRA